MPLSVNGFGTAYYGEADYRLDGSFVTTEWVCLAFIPVYPLKSMRLVRDHSDDMNVVIFHNIGFRVVEALPLQFNQVARVYAFIVFLAMWWATVTWFCFTKFEKTDPRLNLVMAGWIVSMAVPIATVVIFRKLSQNRITRSHKK